MATPKRRAMAAEVSGTVPSQMKPITAAKTMVPHSVGTLAAKIATQMVRSR